MFRIKLEQSNERCVLCGNNNALFGAGGGDSMHGNQQKRAEYCQHLKLSLSKEWKWCCEIDISAIHSMLSVTRCKA